MNALPFTSIATSLIAALTFFPGPRSANSSTSGLSAVPQRSAIAMIAPVKSWDETMDVVADNSELFRVTTLQQIEEYARRTQGLSRRGEPSRVYLQTRTQALREQIDYARGELLKLPSSQGDPEFTPAHAHFQRTMSGLQDAFVQLQDEVTVESGT